MTHAVLYAAGFGTRMGDLIANTPKPMLDLGGKPIIERVCSTLIEGGVKQIHINSFYLAEQIGAYFNLRPNIHIHYEPDGPYETGGTLKSLVGMLPETVITANSDTLFLSHNPLELLYKSWSNEWDAMLVLIPRANALHHLGKGDFYLENERPVWRGNRETAPYVYSGLQMIRPKFATSTHEKNFSVKVLWDEMLKTGRLGAVVYDGAWIDIGTKEALISAREHWVAK